MRLLIAEVTNFGSYEYQTFDFSYQGLALIHGATGSGKSTLQDIPTWILYGQTAKNGNVDDILSWTNAGKPTKGSIKVQINDTLITVTRIRGKGLNDLYWDEDGQVHRGKDSIDTQKLLDKRLGVDYTTYINASYYNEFSPTGTFFTAKASDRRELFENLANLELPVKLTEGIVDVKKEVRKTFTQTLEKLNKTVGRLDQLKRTAASVKVDAARWEDTQKKLIEEFQAKSKNFDKEKCFLIGVVGLKIDRFESSRTAKVKRLNEELQKKVSHFKEEKVCYNCGVVKEHDSKELLELDNHYQNLITFEMNLENPHHNELYRVEREENLYNSRIIEESNKVNPFLSQMHTIFSDTENLENEQKDQQNQIEALNHKQASLAQLQKIVIQLRSELLTNSIRNIESEVNRYLESYFDSELRVRFELDNSDNLNTALWKSGYECSYRQLSKGQRSLLKLAFSVAVMTSVSNKTGVNFETLMFDESLDGLDSSLKLKAFSLFSELSLRHPSILVIDHSEELQNLFNKRYHVTINNDASSIEEKLND